MTDIDKGASVRHLMKFLEPWMKDDTITEICINRPDELFVERQSKWEQHVVEVSTERLMQMATAVAVYANNDITDTRPLLSAVLPGGERIQIVIPSACEDGTISVTIRKPSFAVRTIDSYREQGFFEKIKPITGEMSKQDGELLELMQARKYDEFMRLAVQYAKVIVVAGETGSGKTTFMRALMQEIPKTQRLITIEDVPELFLPNHPNHVHLFYPSEARADGVVTSASLLRSCLRMKPDRILLAELRGAETFDFINVCSSGHAGSITSCHAGNAELTFERLALMVLQNEQGRTLPYEVIRRLLYTVVDVVVHVHNDTVGLDGRHITEIWFDPRMKRRHRE